MGYKSLIEEQVQSAMRILGTDSDGLAPKHTYISADLAGATYDPATQTYTPNDVEHADVPMVLAKFRIEEIDASIVPTTDRKALIAALDLTPTPKEQDRIRLSDGTNYNVERILGVPGESLHILHIRKTD